MTEPYGSFNLKYIENCHLSVGYIPMLSIYKLGFTWRRMVRMMNDDALEGIGKEAFLTKKTSRKTSVRKSDALRMITNAPWYVSNLMLHNDLKIPFVQEAIALFATKYNNQLISNLFHQSTNARRLQKTWPEDLAT
jgi:hypothetical protein